MPSVTSTAAGSLARAVSTQQAPVTTASTGTGQILRTATGAVPATAQAAVIALGAWWRKPCSSPLPNRTSPIATAAVTASIASHCLSVSRYASGGRGAVATSSLAAILRTVIAGAVARVHPRSQARYKYGGSE